MAKKPNNWYVITGSPSSGKTTIIKSLASLGYSTVTEMGRYLIDQQMAEGKTLGQVNVDSPEFEEAWVKLQRDKEASLPPDELIFFDRGTLDTLSYFAYYGWPVTKEIKKWCDEATYKKAFLLEQLDFEIDYARVESAKTAREMQKYFKAAYQAAGYEVITIPRDTIKNRLDQILANL